MTDLCFDMADTIRKTASYIVLISTYCFTWLVATLGRMLPRRRWKPNGRIQVTGTIVNPNWYLSHITPLTLCGVKEVILVVDEPMQPLDRVRFVCPPKWLAKLISRAGAKAIWMLYAGVRYRPDLFMGYNLVAGGCTALVAGAILGRPACYQMTGGYLVLSTVDVELHEPGRTDGLRQRFHMAVERLAISIIRKLDLVIVRGSKAKAFLASHGVDRHVAIITGSARENKLAKEAGRSIDLACVGRLNPIKQVDQFVRIVSEVSRVRPSVRAAVVGDGELMAELRAYAKELGLAGEIEFLGKREDIEDLLAAAKVFVLTSKSEGLSIALAEAMMAGAVPVVANVGELGDLVQDGINGYLIKPNNIDEYVARSISLLCDDDCRNQVSANAMETARKQTHIDMVSEAWRRSLEDVIMRTSRFRTESTAQDRSF